jgi:hypothetical protein
MRLPLAIQRAASDGSMALSKAMTSRSSSECMCRRVGGPLPVTNQYSRTPKAIATGTNSNAGMVACFIDSHSRAFAGGNPVSRERLSGVGSMPRVTIAPRNLPLKVSKFFRAFGYDQHKTNALSVVNQRQASVTCTTSPDFEIHRSSPARESVFALGSSGSFSIRNHAS